MHDPQAAPSDICKYAPPGSTGSAEFWYKITTDGSGYCLDLRGYDTTPGAQVWLYKCNTEVSIAANPKTGSYLLRMDHISGPALPLFVLFSSQGLIDMGQRNPSDMGQRNPSDMGPRYLQTNQAWAFIHSVTNAGAYTIRPYLSPNMCLSFSSQVGLGYSPDRTVGPQMNPYGCSLSTVAFLQSEFFVPGKERGPQDHELRPGPVRAARLFYQFDRVMRRL